MSSVTIFGLREEPRPKGTGYLYVSYDGAHEGMPLAYFHFYKTTDDELREILQGVLSKLPDISSLQHYELVNFGASTEVIFREVAAKVSLHR